MEFIWVAVNPEDKDQNVVSFIDPGVPGYYFLAKDAGDGSVIGWWKKYKLEEVEVDG